MATASASAPLTRTMATAPAPLAVEIGAMVSREYTLVDVSDSSRGGKSARYGPDAEETSKARERTWLGEQPSRDSARAGGADRAPDRSRRGGADLRRRFGGSPSRRRPMPGGRFAAHAPSAGWDS